MSKTLEMMNILQEEQQESWPRAHLGASQLGKPCERQLWYGFRQTLQNDHSALTLRRFDDGHCYGVFSQAKGFLRPLDGEPAAQSP